jgi:hypothetical protein
VDLVVTEALGARSLAERTGGEAVWLPTPDGRVPIALGLWKGDLTLERAVVDEVRRLQREGFVDDLVDAYALAPLQESCPFCR